MKRTRRTALFAALTAAATILAACGGSDSDDDGANADDGATGDFSGQQMVFVNYGGETMKAAKAAWLGPFAAETGVQFATDEPSDPAKVKAMVEAGNTTWDVIDIDPATGGASCGELYELRGPDVDMSAFDPETITDDCGVPIMLQSVALVYSKKKFGDNPPTTITDWSNLEEFPGTRITYNNPPGGYEGILLGDGVAPADVYPFDYDRAAEAVKKLGNNLRLAPTLAAQAEALIADDFALCWCYLGRAAQNQLDGADLGVVWDVTWAPWDALYAVKGSKYPEAQQAFLNYVATPEAQAAFTEQMPYGPMTPSSQPNIQPEFEDFLPGFNEDKIEETLLVDWEFWTTHADEAFQKWTEITAG